MKDNKPVQYSSDYLIQYVKGELSNAESHALEKAALSDPFLADAIYGYETAMKKFGTQKVQETAEQIKPSQPLQKFALKYLPQIKYGAAAAVLILATSIGYFVYRSPDKGLAPERSTANTISPFYDSTANTLITPDQPAAAMARSNVVDNENLLESYHIQLCFIDENDRPVANQKVNIYQQSYTTNEQGLISIRPLKVGTNFTLSIPSYQPLQIAIPPGFKDTAYIQLLPVSAEKSRTNTSHERTYAPEGGWYLFQEFVNKNKIIPQNNPFVKGSVIVRARLSEKNELSGFEVIQPLNPTYDMEAVRLIQNYNKWKNKMSAPIVIHIEVNF